MGWVGRRVTSIGALIALLLALCATGCGLFSHGTHNRLPVRSEPLGAHVWVDGSYAGVTPLRIDLESPRAHIVEIRRPGYQPKAYRIEPRVEAGYVVMDILMTGVAGIVIDAATGGWRHLHPERLDARLARLAPGQQAPPPRVSASPSRPLPPRGVPPTAPGVPAVPEGYGTP